MNARGGIRELVEHVVEPDSPRRRTADRKSGTLRHRAGSCARWLGSVGAVEVIRILVRRATRFDCIATTSLIRCMKRNAARTRPTSIATVRSNATVRHECEQQHQTVADRPLHQVPETLDFGHVPGDDRITAASAANGYGT
jgi:hypothetical protein